MHATRLQTLTGVLCILGLLTFALAHEPSARPGKAPATPDASEIPILRPSPEFRSVRTLPPAALEAAVAGRRSSVNSQAAPTGIVPIDPPSFVNWENPHVHPLDMTPDGARLLAVNTADNRLEVFEIVPTGLNHLGSIPVGLDPVSVRARTNREAWVVNHISDSVSLVDLQTMNVIRTFRTDDEPADVVFAGTPQRAYVSCSQANTVLVVNPLNVHASVVDFAMLPNPGHVHALGLQTIRIRIDGEDPRALAVSGDGSRVYVGVFESGNRTTILGGGSLGLGFPPNVVNDPLSPYFNPDLPFQLGINPPNPPPNSGDAFSPPISPDLPNPPRVGLIVRKNPLGNWMDDNNHDWTDLVSGANAALSGRPVGWDLVDHDVAILNTGTLGVTYATGVMNLCMALAVNPANQEVTVVGTEATNEVRFEPNLTSRFLRVNMGRVNPAGPTTLGVTDLNPHLTYPPGPVFQPSPQDMRNASLGDPRGIAWTSDGARGFVTGMGSNNVVVIDAIGARLLPRPINVGEGPTGVVVDEPRNRVYVLNKFEASVSIINASSNIEALPRTPLFDPTPQAVRTGRKHNYDTHLNSGTGHVACASCHADARMERLGWDLGNPAGEMKQFNQNCNASPTAPCQDWHPMKGPMTTQTLQDIVGNEPHHWRGDRDGIEEFASAFEGLLGDDQPLPDAEMQEFEDFLASLHFPPNPFRNFDNTLPADLPLSGHFSDGRFESQGGLPPGAPLPNGNAQTGLLFYRLAQLDGVSCVSCHTLPTGMGPDGVFVNGTFQQLPLGPKGEHHLMITSADGSTNRSIKVPHLRNQYEKVGFDTTQQFNRAGFGFLHDGSIDSITRFTSLPVFGFTADQQIADMVAFMLAFSGSELPLGDPNNPLEPPGPDSQDSHAAVGWQTTLDDDTDPTPPQTSLINDMMVLADQLKVGLVAKGVQQGLQRGYAYIPGSGQFQSDREAEIVDADDLAAAAAPGSELTFTVVPFGSEARIGIDRDEDGFFDRDELDNCSDPADADITPVLRGDLTLDGLVNFDDVDPFVTVLVHPELDQFEATRADLNCDGLADGLDVQPFTDKLLAGG